MKPLTLPPAALADPDSVQMISAWIAQKGLHCSLKIGMWQELGVNEPAAWGRLLSDVVRHIADAHSKEFGVAQEVTVEKVITALIREIEEPTSKTRGAFSVGGH